MAEESNGKGPPAIVQWKLAPPRSPSSERVYEQATLSLDGEARLLGLAGELAVKLKDSGVDWQRVDKLFDDPLGDPAYVMELIGVVTEVAPESIAEFCLVCFGVYPTDEDGRPDAAYLEHKKFVRSAVNLSKVADIVAVFVEQNDYARLARPFAARWRGLTETGRAALPTRTPTDEPSPPPAPSSSKPATVRPRRRSRAASRAGSS